MESSIKDLEPIESVIILLSQLSQPTKRTKMKSTVCCLLVLAVAAQAQWYNNYGYGPENYGGYGGYYPVAPVAYSGVPAPVAYSGVPAPVAYSGVPAPVAYTGIPAAVPAAVPAYPSFTSTQFHAQDELGQARFGYAHPGQASTNYRDAMGNQIGSYAYFNPEGKEVRVSYTADHRGFRVLSNDLPVAPVANLVAPVPIPETVEVAQAKAAHLAAHAEAKAAHAAAKAALPVTPVAAAAAPTTA